MRRLISFTLMCIYAAAASGQPIDEEHQPPPLDPLVGAQEQDPNEHGMEPLPAPAAERKFEPGWLASQQFGILVFAVGLAGWIALGVAVFVLERNRPQPMKDQRLAVGS